MKEEMAGGGGGGGGYLFERVDVSSSETEIVPNERA